MTKTQRATIIQAIDRTTDYDASTVVIHRDGNITAIRDADKTFNGPETVRLLVGHVSDYLAA